MQYLRNPIKLIFSAYFFFWKLENKHVDQDLNIEYIFEFDMNDIRKD